MHLNEGLEKADLTSQVSVNHNFRVAGLFEDSLCKMTKK